jgi:hypothetical protein
VTLSNMMHVYVASLAWVIYGQGGCRDVRYRPPGKRPVTEPTCMGFSDGRRFFPHMDMEHKVNASPCIIWHACRSM